MTSAFTCRQSRAHTGPLVADSDTFKTLQSSFSRRFQLSIFRDSGMRDVDSCSAKGEVAQLRIPRRDVGFASTTSCVLFLCPHHISTASQPPQSMEEMCGLRTISKTW